MEGNYSVRFGKQKVGRISVWRQGLYYHFNCRCRLNGDIMCRLRVICGGTQETLGILIPVEDGFGLDTKVPVKRFGEGTPEFSLVPKEAGTSGTIYPVYPDEPFAYITQLKKAYLIRQNTGFAISFHEKQGC